MVTKIEKFPIFIFADLLSNLGHFADQSQRQAEYDGVLAMYKPKGRNVSIAVSRSVTHFLHFFLQI